MQELTSLVYGATGGEDQPPLLYALDGSWQKPGEGGLFRLDAALQTGGQTALKAVRIARLIRPTSMALAKDGSLFVTLLGPVDADSGRLVRFASGL
jgi:hypothetical protein